MSYSSPLKEFSTRHRVKPGRRARSAEDEALVQHVHASLYPFDAQPTNPCFKVQLPSRKFKTYARGTFSTAANPAAVNNWGFVYITPIFCNNPIVNECAFSTGTAVGHDGFTNATVLPATNSPYTRTDFAISFGQARPLSCALRVRNITPMLNRGGTLYAMKSPNDAELTTQPFDVQIPELDVIGHVHRCDTSGDGWQTISWCPRDIDQMEYTPNPSCQNFSGNQMIRTLAFVAQAPGPGTNLALQQTYEFEACWHWDMITVDSRTEQQHGLTRGLSHPHVEKVQQIIGELQTKPQVIQNNASNAIANFVVDVIDAGTGVNEVVNAVCDIASRTAAVLPSVYRRIRALGSFL